MDPTSTQSIELLIWLAFFLFCVVPLWGTASRARNVERQLNETNRLLLSIADFLHRHEEGAK